MKNRILFVGLLALAVISSPAFADPNTQTCQGIGTCTLNDNDPITNTNTATGGAASNTNTISNTANGGTGGQGGKGGEGGTVAFSGNSNVDVDQVTKNLNNNVNLTHVSNKQKQDQDQKQHQGQDQSQHQKVEDSGNSSITWNEKRDVASAFTGNTTIANDSCGSSVGAGAQGPAFGLSLNFAREDGVCEMLKLSRRLQDLGYGDAAVAILCQDERVAIALPRCTSAAIKE